EDQVQIDDDVEVVVRDGTRLSARLFRPTEGGPHPVILSLTSYGKELGPDAYPAVLDNWTNPDIDLGTFTVSPWTSWEAPDPATWVLDGYAVMYVDVRGYFDSEGDASLFSPQEAEDFYDVIEWAGAQDWSNGNVGLMGVSYLAISQWVAAGTQPPSLKAMVPWEGQTDAFREVLYHGGVPETAFTEFWLGRVLSLANTPPLPFTVEQFKVIQANPQAIKNAIPETVILPELAEVPALVCATWSDQGLHTRGSFEAFEKSMADQKWLYTHGRTKWEMFYSDEALADQKRFFDHFLKDADNGMEDVARVRLEVRESLEVFEVRDEQEWPIARTEYRQLYLDGPSGALSEEAPAEASTTTYEPLSESATFVYRFDADTELTGNMKLRLWISTAAGDNMDLFVGVNKLDADGEEVYFYAKTGYVHGPVAMGWLRVSERELDEALSTPWQPVLSHDNPQFVAPDEIVAVDIEILPSSTLFRAGESLQLVVQGADLFAHPSLAHAHSDPVNEGAHTIHAGGENHSH
ncbi:MAG: CocE/NonD family hydrolase, partial [Myxococcota bacterium]